MKVQTRSFVVEPYAAELTGLWRVLSWAAIPVLVLGCLWAGFFYALTTPYMIPQFLAPLILLALCVIWALPDMHRAPDRLMGKFFFTFVVAALVWPNYMAITLPGMPWITAVRLFGLPTAFFLLICVSVSADFRAKLGAVLKAIPALWPLIVGFIAIQVFSMVFSSEIGESVNALVDIEINTTVMFFAACYLALQPGVAERWATIMWISAVALSLCGIWEAQLQHVPWAGHIPSFLQVNDPYVQKVLAGVRRLGTDKYRVQGTHSTSLGLAEYLALTAPFVIHYMMGSYKPVVKFLAGISLPLIFYTIIATDARLGVVGFFVAVLLYALYWGVMRWRLTPGSIFGPAVVLAYPAIFAVFMAATFFVQRLHNMVWGGSNTRFSNDGRSEQVAQGMPKILSHPWGYGIGRGAQVLDYHNEAGVLTIDTYYLLVALDYGVLGFLAYYVGILVVIWHCAKSALDPRTMQREETQLIPLGIALTAFFIIKSIFSQTENHTLQYMMMGIAAALIYRVQIRQGGKDQPPGPVVSGPRASARVRASASSDVRSGA